MFIPGFPKETLLIQSGLVFGFIWGGIINWFAMVVGAQIGYEVVRRSIETGGKFHLLLSRYQNSKFIRKLDEKGNFGLFLIRLTPNAPNDLLSLSAGALLLPRKGFFIISVVSFLPYAFLFSYIGSIGSNFFDNSLLLRVNIVIMILSVVFIGVLRFLSKPIVIEN
ncbi:MAG: VTT domain-containing protein [Candidatus Kariarchaeaceae archaeon]